MEKKILKPYYDRVLLKEEFSKILKNRGLSWQSWQSLHSVHEKDWKKRKDTICIITTKETTPAGIFGPDTGIIFSKIAEKYQIEIEHYSYTPEDSPTPIEEYHYLATLCGNSEEEFFIAIERIERTIKEFKEAVERFERAKGKINKQYRDRILKLAGLK